MADSKLRAEIKTVLKRNGLKYKLKHHNVKDSKGGLNFIDLRSGKHVWGKFVRAFNEGEVYHWPLLNHQNIAPLIDVLYIREDLSIFLTTDHQVPLKEIVHDEDFVYDKSCFNRKQSYAKGIFSGLTYLHGKSLCLMNLSDDNIAICKIYDKAVITDFSCLICSRKTTRSKMKVPEVYKAPETEKEEFDPIMAEIWSSGTLMLDMFLAHMVPWAVVDYKPEKVMEIVNMLNLELLQAANIGSVVTAVDLAKFKTFLKCFFRQSPPTRITARLASIASFLHPKLQDTTLRTELPGRTASPDAKLTTQNVEKEREHFTSNYVSYNSDLRSYTTKVFPTSKEAPENPIPVKNSKTCKDLLSCSRQPDTSKQITFNSKPSMLHSPTLNGRRNPLEKTGIAGSVTNSKQTIKEELLEEINDETSTFHGTNSLNAYRQEEGSQLVKPPFPFFYESSYDKTFQTSEISVGLEETADNSQTFKYEINAYDEDNSACYPSKSVSFIKSKPDDTDDVVSLEFCSKTVMSYPNIKSMSTKQLSDLQNSDLCLDRLFENNLTGDINQRAHANPYAFEVIRSKNVPDPRKSGKPVPYKHEACVSFTDSHQMPSRLHRNDGRLLNEYKLLLRQEYIRLRKKLENEYQLKLVDLMNLNKSLNSMSKNAGNPRKNLPSTANRNIPFKVYENRSLETSRPKDNIKMDVGNINFKDTNTISKVQLNRRYSYYKAIEMNTDRMKKPSAANRQKEKLESIFPEENRSKDKLIESSFGNFDEKAVEVIAEEHSFKSGPYETENYTEREPLHRVTEESDNGPLKNKRKGKKDKKEKSKQENNKKEKKDKSKNNEKKDKTGKSKKDTTEDNDKKKRNKKLPDPKRADEMKSSFFFSLCPGGKVEESIPTLDNLCETCKLHLEMI